MWCFYSTDSPFHSVAQIRKSDLTQSYYFVSSSNVNYYDALKLASEATFAGVSGHLWIPRSFLDFEHIVNTFVRPVYIDRFWLATTDVAIEGKWVIGAGPYIGEDISDLLPWEQGEPQGGVSENCAIHIPGYAWVGDIACSMKHKFVIEFECGFGQRFNDQGTACIGKTA